MHGLFPTWQQPKWEQALPVLSPSYAEHPRPKRQAALSSYLTISMRCTAGGLKAAPLIAPLLPQKLMPSGEGKGEIAPFPAVHSARKWHKCSRLCRRMDKQQPGEAARKEAR